MDNYFSFLLILITSIFINIFFFVFLFIFFKIQVSKSKENVFEKFDIISDYACSTSCLEYNDIILSILNFVTGNYLKNSENKVILIGIDKKNMDKDIKIVHQIGTQIYKKINNYLQNTQQDFIIFYEKENFMGKVFFINIFKNHEWISPFFIEEFEENNESNENKEENETSNNENKKKFLDFSQFVKAFEFYRGRHFSCKIPYNHTVQFVPTQQDNIDSSPLILEGGNHESVHYVKSPLMKLIIK